jgi:VIT1/CCC1 family predicted Fe2+/Mn2+ transporter
MNPYRSHNRVMRLSVEDFVYGAVDGSVTTFAVVAGVIGAELSPSIVLILGFNTIGLILLMMIVIPLSHNIYVI